jgi:hypothetical protein
MTTIPQRIYHCMRRSDGSVICQAERVGDVPRLLANIGYHSPDGFEMGYGGSGPADLALTILLDHLHVPVEEALHAYREGFKTTDKRVIEAWMSHQRLNEQRISRYHEDCSVSETELEHLLTTGFLTETLALEWERGKVARENEQRAKTKHLSYEKAKGEVKS